MARRPVAERRRLRDGLRFRWADVDDLDLLVTHRVAMWRAIGTRTDASIDDHAPLYRAWLRPRLVSGETEALVADVKGRPAGSCVLWWMPAHPRPGLPVEYEPYLMSMFTEPAYRGVGLATDLVEQLTLRAQRHGAYRVLLHASAEGRSVYRRLGFEDTSEMRKLIRAPIGLRPAKRAVKRRGRAGSRR
jgi:GNAT superfamily N-acetyltransferase